MPDSQSRRGLLASVRRNALPIRRRPPGAIRELEFLSKCTACGDCVVACPHNAVHTLAVGTPIGAGTPVMVPDARPCHMCEGFPCAAACPEEALVVPTGDTWPLGSVHVDESTCLPFRGPECGACSGLCPEPVAGALTLQRGRPVIGPECIGCGLCIDACVTEPKSLKLRPI